jgi:hypothetical protein
MKNAAAEKVLALAKGMNGNYCLPVNKTGLLTAGDFCQNNFF